MRNTNNNNPSHWRNNWFIKNWLAAIQLVRAVAEGKLSDGADQFLGDSFILLGGAIIIASHIPRMQKDENPIIMNTKMTASMVIGMGAGMAAYNTVKVVRSNFQKPFSRKKRKLMQKTRPKLNKPI